MKRRKKKHQPVNSSSSQSPANGEEKEAASASQFFFITASCRSSPHVTPRTWRTTQSNILYFRCVQELFDPLQRESENFPPTTEYSPKGMNARGVLFPPLLLLGLAGFSPLSRRWPEGDGGHPSARPNEGREDVTPSVAGLTKWRRGYPGVQRLASKTDTGGGKHRHTKNRRATSHSGTQKPWAWGLSTAAAMVEERQHPQSLHYLGILCHRVVSTVTICDTTI